MTYGVLFVCTGNICRSPTAHGVFRHYVSEAGLGRHFLIDSAGTHGYHVGEPPDNRTIDVAAGRGFALHDLRARRLQTQDYHDFDLILAMDSGHFDIMRQMQPQGSRADLAMFLDYAPQAARGDVPDPYYGGRKDFEHVLDLCESASAGLLTALRKELAL